MPSDTDATKPSLTLVVHDVFSHNYVPLVKVLFCDHSVISFPLEDARNSLSAAKYKEVLLEVMANKEENPMIHMTSKVKFKKIYSRKRLMLAILLKLTFQKYSDILRKSSTRFNPNNGKIR